MRLETDGLSVFRARYRSALHRRVSKPPLLRYPAFRVTRPGALRTYRQTRFGLEPPELSRVRVSIPTMRRSASSRPAFPFLGAALLLAVAAAVCAGAFAAYLPAVTLAALGLISAHLGMPAPEPIRVGARASRGSRYDC